jgi:hypothetical protein
MSDTGEFSVETMVARKSAARRARARLPLTEKVEIVERMRTEFAAFAAIRAARRNATRVVGTVSD